MSQMPKEGRFEYGKMDRQTGAQWVHVTPDMARGHPQGKVNAPIVIIALIFVGQVLELRARERTGDAIRALLDLAPKTARRILHDGTEYDAPLENVVTGDMLRVRPGDSGDVRRTPFR